VNLTCLGLLLLLAAGQEPAGEAELEWWVKTYHFLREQLVEFARENPVVVAFAVIGALRTLGTTVRSGYTGLFFNCGRATRVLGPGFVFKIPFFQAVKVVPTRSRTMDVPHQKVTSADGLVWFVDVNLVYRVVDVRKALIEIDDLVNGMEQMMAISVQEIVRRSGREDLRLSGELDSQLERSMERRLEPWGVEVERAGFTSIKPSAKTLRFTQQFHASEERQRNLGRLVSRGLDRGPALAMLGSAPRVQRRAQRAAERESRSRRRRRILHAVSLAEREADLRVPAGLRTEVRARAVEHLA